MPQSVITKCRGLHTFPNHLSQIPEGSLIEAENVVVDREGVISPRRGFAVYGDVLDGVSSVRAKQLLSYKNRIIRHYSTLLEFDDGSGTFTAFNDNTGADASVTEVTSGLRIKGVEMNGNLYLTTSTGLKKISAASAALLSSATLVDAGMPAALDGTGELNVATGFLTQDSTVAYRVVWGYKDANSNLILGEPSERIVVSSSLLSLLITDFNGLLTQLDTMAPVGVTLTATATSGSPTLTAIANTTALTVGMAISGTGITPGTVINAIGASTVTMSANATVAATGVPGSFSFADRLSDTDYNTLRLSSSTNALTLHAALTALAQKLDTDMGVTTYYNSGGAPSIYNDHVTEPAIIATTAQLEDLQEFYDDIVNALLVEGNLQICANAQTAGTLANSVQSSTVDLTFTIPSGITTNHFYQLYRTSVRASTGASLLSDIDPGDEMGLVYEANPTSGQITALSVSLTDVTPDSFRGANLYTNPNSGEGIAQANSQPPLAKDIASFKGSLFLANTQTRHRKQVSLLSASALTNKTFTIGVVGGGTLVYTFVDSAKTTEITCVSGANIAKAPSTVDHFTLYSAGDELRYKVWFDVDGANAAPAGGTGITLLEVDILSSDTATQVAEKLAAALDDLDEFDVTSLSSVVTVVNTKVGTSTAPSESVANAGFTITIPTGKDGSGEDTGVARKVAIGNEATAAQAVDSTARSLVRVINAQASEAVYARYISGPNDVPGAIVLEAKALGSAAFYLLAHADIVEKFNPTLPSAGATELSDNEVAPNRVYYSKYQEPEAVPLLNYLDIGAKDKVILRILPLRDGLFVLKEDGVYRISGDAGSFGVTPVDSSTTCKAADSAAVLANRIYMVSDQGVVAVSDTGIDIISRSIENLILPVTAYANFTNNTFALGYESDRAYMLWTVKKASDATATQCLRYNTITNAWTIWTLEKTCAVINSDRLYLGAGDTNYIEQERKSFTRLDHVDRATDITIPESALQGTSLYLGSLFGIEQGDAIVQTQYLTIAQFNRLLKKLDDDRGVTDTNYYSLLQASAGANLSAKLTALCTKLNADTGVTDTNYTSSGSTAFATMQTDFNTIAAKLDLDAGTQSNNYPTSSGTTVYEILVDSANSFNSTLTLVNTCPLILGAAEAFKRISTKVTWAPNHFGDPSVYKQVSEATILFENQAFTSGTASYASDLSPGYEDVPVVGEGTGTFGSAVFGRRVWGGEGTSAPFRTYVPRQKMRCRYVYCRFEHAAAFEKYAIYGISWTMNLHSQRAYR